MKGSRANALDADGENEAKECISASKPSWDLSTVNVNSRWGGS